MPAGMNLDDEEHGCLMEIIAKAIIIVPALALLALLYWGGAAFGGFWAGVANVVLTLLGAFVWWLFRRRKR